MRKTDSLHASTAGVVHPVSVTAPGLLCTQGLHISVKGAIVERLQFDLDAFCFPVEQ
jgi:hypothetical protein